MFGFCERVREILEGILGRHRTFSTEPPRAALGAHREKLSACGAFSGGGARVPHRNSLGVFHWAPSGRSDSTAIRIGAIMAVQTHFSVN